MNARQMADKLMGHRFDSNYGVVLLFDGTWYTPSMAEQRGWDIIPCMANLCTIGCNLLEEPLVEALINSIVTEFTDPSTGGVRQHTESVNNFTVRTGKLIGIYMRYFPNQHPDDSSVCFNGVFTNE